MSDAVCLFFLLTVLVRHAPTYACPVKFTRAHRQTVHFSSTRVGLLVYPPPYPFSGLIRTDRDVNFFVKLSDRTHAILSLLELLLSDRAVVLGETCAQPIILSGL